MKKAITHLFAFLYSLQIIAQKPVDYSNQEIVFKNVTVVPMSSETVLYNQDVIIKNGSIKAIGKKLSYEKNALIIDAKGKFLIPGLADMHGHLPMGDDAAAMKDALMLFASKGITTLRTMLGNPKHVEAKNKVQSGEFFGPRLYVSGPSFSGMSIKTPQEAREKVISQKQEGYDILKMHPGLSKENYEVVAKTAKEVGIDFGGHISFNVGLKKAVETGYKTIDHLDGIILSLIPRLDTLSESEAGMFGMHEAYHADLSKIESTLQFIKQNDVWLVPTQSFAEHWHAPYNSAEDLLKFPDMNYVEKKTLENWTKMKNNTVSDKRYDSNHILRYLEIRRLVIKESQRLGVGLLAGTDAPQVFSVPGFALHRELKYFVDAGLTPYQALCTATINVGRFLKNDNIGIIKKDAIADLVLLSENPLKDINAVSAIDGVMLNGRWLSKKDIEDAQKKLVKQ